MKGFGWVTKALRNCQEFVSVGEYFFAMLCRSFVSNNCVVICNSCHRFNIQYLSQFLIITRHNCNKIELPQLVINQAVVICNNFIVIFFNTLRANLAQRPVLSKQTLRL